MSRRAGAVKPLIGVGGTEQSEATPGSPRRPMGRSQPDTNGVFTIGVAGGTGSGKTTLCKALQKEVGDLGTGRVECSSSTKYNFDHPDALDEDKIVETLLKLREREVVTLTPYERETSARATEPLSLEPHDVVILEGILALYSARVRALLDLKLFVDLDSDIRLSTRVVRDVGLGRELDTILEQYITMVKPAFEEFAEPTKKHADLVIPRGSENSRATELVKEHILSVLSKIDFDNNVMANSPDLNVKTPPARENSVNRKASEVPH